MRLTESELSQWGRRLGETLEVPIVLALAGPLGAGKSVLARAIGEGAGRIAYTCQVVLMSGIRSPFEHGTVTPGTSPQM